MTGTSKCRVDDVFKQLVMLQIRDLGIVNEYTGIRLTPSSEFGYKIDQEQMINKLMLKFV